MNKRKLILLAIHSCSYSGAPLLGLNIVKELKKRGYFIFTICMEKGPLFNQYKKYCYIVHSESLKKTDIIIRLLKWIGVRNVICNTVVTGHIVKIAYKNKLRVITLIHELPRAIKSMKAEGKVKDISKYSDYIIFPNKFVREKLLKLYSINYNKILVKSQGLYMNIHKNYDEETKLKNKIKMGFLPEDRIVIGIGHGGLIKGLDIFIRVAANIHRQDKRIRFIWIGEIDSKYNWIRQHAENKGITLIAPTNRIENYYRIADLYLLTSREDSFPSAVLEAIAYGIPVLGFKDAGGFVELDSKFIKLVNYLDSGAMEDSVIDMLSDSSLINYLHNNGKEYIRQNFNFPQYIDYLIDLFGSDR